MSRWVLYLDKLKFIKTLDYEILKKEEYLRQKDKKLKKVIDSNGHISFQP